MNLKNEYYVKDFRVLEFDVLENTMKPLFVPKDKDVVFTDDQKSAKGKGNREWKVKKGNLYLTSFLNAKDFKQPFLFTFVAAIAMRRVIESFVGVDKKVQCKWPNDILIDGKKCVGILLELDSKTQFLKVAAGVNIIFYPENVSYAATCLKEQGSDVCAKEFLDKFVEVFSSCCSEFKAKGFEVIRNEWLKYAYNLRKQITVKLDEKEYIGVFEDLDKEGNLVLKLENGAVQKISSGDVF